MNFKLWLEQQALTKEMFFNLANQQRDLPEKAMLNFQRIMGGGIMNSAAEHIGDLIHRMTEQPTFHSAGYYYVKEKVDKTLKWMMNEYGFEREFEENIKNNANYLKIDESEFRKKIYLALGQYANEHAKLPTYNRAQRLANFAAVSLGERRYKDVIRALISLDLKLKNQEEWVKFAHEELSDLTV
jgi:hypothetical protein